MTNVECPPNDILSAFAVGRTTDAEALAIETHLATCPQCVAMLDRATADSLVAAVKASLPAVQNGVEHSIPELIGIEFPAVVRAETTQIYPRSPTDTQISSSPVTGKHATEEHYRFLSPSTEPGSIGRLGPYRILEQLGCGGMGAVFRAEDPQLQRPVALKVMRPHALGAPEASQRFLAEARAAAKLKHDHVVTIYQVGEDRGVAFIAMELLEGESLDSLLAREERLSIEEACRIGMETASALSAAHAAGLVHRDIKPANLWLDSSSGRTRVLDFGLARASESEVNLTSSGAIVGTPAYMAPEQARGESVDGRTDLFALGVVIYRAITGRLPFRGQNAVGTLLEVTAHTPPTPRSLNADIPQELSALVVKLLAKDPAQRPQTAAEVSSELARIRSNAVQTNAQRLGASRNRPWKTISAGFLAFCAAVAAVVVIVRDNDGNKVAEFTVPNGASVEVRTKAPVANAKTLTPSLNPAGTDKPQLEVDEPPSLKEWLIDRKVLTVAQDGSGKFANIQAALKALQPGQAIQVQGPGPYREQINIPDLPPDSGIFGTNDAVIECTEWQEAYKEPDVAGKIHQVYTGHILGHPQGFRLSGLKFTFPARGMRLVQRLTIPHARNLMIEDCVIRATDGGGHQFINITNFGGSLDPAMTAIVRNCVIESQLWFSTQTPQSKILVEKNLFLGPADEEHLVIADANLATAILRNNVFAAESASSMTIARLKHCDHLEIVNNSLGGRNGIHFIGACPETATIRNNLHFGTGTFVVLMEGAHEQRGQLFQREEFDHNAYHTMMISSAGAIAPRRMVGDQIGEFKFLSTNPQNRDFMRMSSDGTTPAEKGAGGDLASYIGALAPGPVGPQGDWFTLLLDRWKRGANGSQSAPSKTTPDPLAEAPELVEWLKGRTILTVSQGAEGQFKTIQAALDAMQPGQAVQVLDKGPYRERIEVLALPPDSGLFTRAQTVVELTQWQPAWKEPAPQFGGVAEIYHGHVFERANGFRLHGFDFRFPAPVGEYEKGKWHRRIRVRQPRDFTFEHCVIRGGSGWDGHSLEFTDWDSDRDSGMSLLMRYCALTGSIAITTNPKQTDLAKFPGARIVFDHNYFAGTGTDHHLVIAGESLASLAIRHNIFAGKSENDIAMARSHDLTAVEIDNNILGSIHGVMMVGVVPGGKVTIRNNLRLTDGLVYFSNGAEQQIAKVAQVWNVSHNFYPNVQSAERVPFALPRSPLDRNELPQFLSKDPYEQNYFRIPADAPAASGGVGEKLPKYAGALPPGSAPDQGDWFTRLQQRWFKSN